MGFTIFFLTVQFLQPTLLHIHIHTSPQLFTSVVRILQNTSDTLLKKQKREMETVQWWNCCGNTWRCVAMCIVRDVYSGLPLEVVQWVSLTFYPFFICFLSHSGTYTLTSLNLVYEVLLFQCLYPVSTTRNGHNINFWSKMFHMVCCTISSPAGSQLSGSATSIFGGHEGLWVPGGARLIPGEIKTRWEYWFSWY